MNFTDFIMSNWNYLSRKKLPIRRYKNEKF